MAAGYNFQHAQIAAVGATPTYVDMPAIMSWEPSVTADSEDMNADGIIYTTSYGARVGEGDITFGMVKFPVLALLNGGVVSSSGTGATVIERYEQPGTSVQPPFILSGYVPNVALDKDPAAGLRITTPVNTASPVSATFEQESWVEWTAETSFVANAANVMIIYEKLLTSPTFTNGVMPVNLTAPV